MEVDDDEAEREEDFEASVHVNRMGRERLRTELAEAIEYDEGITPDRFDSVDVSGVTTFHGDIVPVDVYPYFPEHNAKGARPLVLFSLAIEYEGEDFTVPVPALFDPGDELEFNAPLARLLDLSTTDLRLQAMLERVYSLNGKQRLFGTLQEEATGGVPYGYLLENGKAVPPRLPKRLRDARQAAYEELSIADYAAL